MNVINIDQLETMSRDDVLRTVNNLIKRLNQRVNRSEDVEFFLDALLAVLKKPGTCLTSNQKILIIAVLFLCLFSKGKIRNGLMWITYNMVEMTTGKAIIRDGKKNWSRVPKDIEALVKLHVFIWEEDEHDSTGMYCGIPSDFIERIQRVTKNHDYQGRPKKCNQCGGSYIPDWSMLIAKKPMCPHCKKQMDDTDYQQMLRHMGNTIENERVERKQAIEFLDIEVYEVLEARNISSREYANQLLKAEYGIEPQELEALLAARDGTQKTQEPVQSPDTLFSFENEKARTEKDIPVIYECPECHVQSILGVHIRENLKNHDILVCMECEYFFIKPVPARN